MILTAASFRWLRRLAPLLLPVLALALGAATDARAGLLAPSGCPARALSQPFLPWGDPASYFLAPGGGFETADGGWSLTGGATRVAGNEPFHAASASDASSLRLPAGSSATSPSFCVAADEPTVRLFARGPGSLLSGLAVEAEVQNLGVPLVLPVGVVPGLSSAWAPTLPAVFSLSLDQLVLPGDAVVRLRFRPLLWGEWRVDDVYVDPFKDR
jgi:hypothetical protein